MLHAFQNSIMTYTRKSKLAIKLSCILLLSSTLTTSLVPAFSAETRVSTKSGAASISTSSPYRLPDTIAPLKYELEFSPNPAAGKFTGTANIELDFKKSGKSILLNGNELQISNAFLTDKDGSNKVPLQVSMDKKLERISFTTSKEITAGKHFLRCDFKGELNDKLVGFYRSTFKDSSGKVHYLSTTQMEPTDARRMFPCFDEPAFKAVFKIKVKTDKNNTAISNAALAKESIEGDKKVIEFEESKPMSSYLVALCVGEFKATEPVESEGIPIRVWSVQHDPAMGNYARDNAAQLLKYLNAYFGAPYPWKKLDLIAIPDFQAGAMENPGAITFREKYLLADEKESALSTKQDIVSIIAHEMAHLWFGDLVTMKWWDDIWLNEAFATWMADKATDHVKPEWKIIEQFFSKRQRAFLTDSLHSTRSIQAPVEKPEDAHQMFDEITYVKGAAVLRMLEFFLGENTFQNGVSAYIKQHLYGNATTNDLWAALDKASGKRVKNIMDTWCKQPGYPLIKVSTASNGLKLEQERFFLDGTKVCQQSWQIPLGTRALVKNEKESSGELPKYELVSSRASALKTSKNPVYTNGGGFGFYRSQFSTELEQMLKSQITSMKPIERLTFLSDHAALCFSGKMPAAQFLEVLELYRGEENFAVWDCVIECMRKLDRFVSPEARPGFAKFVRHVLRDEYKRLGWESQSGEPEPLKLVRGNVISVLGTIGEDSEVIEKSRKVFDDYAKNPASTNPDILDAAVHVVAYNGARKDFDELKRLWKKADNPEREHRNLFALASFRKPELVDEALKLTLSKEVRSQDAPKMLSEFFDDNTSKNAAWNFMRANWAQIKKAFAPSMLARLADAPSSLSSSTSAKETQAFFAANKIPDGTANINRMLEKVRINSQFAAHSAPELNAWLKKFK